jgi:hypothetical protein
VSKRYTSTMSPEQLAKYEQILVETATVLRTSQNVLVDAIDTPCADSLMDRADKAKNRDPYEISRLLVFTGEDHRQTLLRVLEAQVLPTIRFVLPASPRVGGRGAGCVSAR